MATLRWGDNAGLTFAANALRDGCRIVNAGASDDVALNWVTHAHGPSAVSHVLGGEGSGNALDDVGSFHLTPSAWAGAGNGWVAGDAMKNAWSRSAPFPQSISPHQNFTIEFWWYGEWGTAASYHMLFWLTTGGNGLIYIRLRDIVSKQIGFGVGEGSSPFSKVEPSTTGWATGWQHICLERSGNTVYCYRNGTSLTTGDATLVDTDATWSQYKSEAPPSGRTYRYNDIYLAQAAEHGGVNFSPTRYPAAGSVMLQDGLQATARTLSSVSWTAQTGAGYGEVAAVYYQSASGVWTQIGGAYPTSPITGTWTVPAALTESVKLELSPKGDTLKSETPTLYWAELNIAAAGGAVIPSYYYKRRRS